jgi:hypothetical protein
MRATPGFVLSREADIHHHALADSRGALDSARLRIEAEVEVPVSEAIAHLLTASRTGGWRGGSRSSSSRLARNERHESGCEELPSDCYSADVLTLRCYYTTV